MSKWNVWKPNLIQWGWTWCNHSMCYRTWLMVHSYSMLPQEWNWMIVWPWKWLEWRIRIFTFLWIFSSLNPSLLVIIFRPILVWCCWVYIEEGTRATRMEKNHVIEKNKLWLKICIKSFYFCLISFQLNSNDLLELQGWFLIDYNWENLIHAPLYDYLIFILI